MAFHLNETWRSSREQTPSSRAGFTVVELLVSLTVIATLIALLLPAIAAAREAARRAKCKNNLRQMGAAALNFESLHRHLPGNGWGYLWVGDPGRGVGRDQPGGWIYQLLPFLENSQSAESMQGLTDSVKRDRLGQLCQQPVTVFQCPSRPSPAVSPGNDTLTFANVNLPAMVAKTDYAICEGDFITDTPGGPSSLEEGDDPSYVWQDVSQATGVSFLKSEVQLSQISDGLSQTYLAGEKHVSLDGYDSASDSGNDQPLYSGVDLDIARWTLETPYPDSRSTLYRRFGSAHRSGTHFVFCDGAVKAISYRIDWNIHRGNGNCKDGSKQ